jgi:ribonucleoside-diphosphate reductase alpha chain
MRGNKLRLATSGGRGHMETAVAALEDHTGGFPAVEGDTAVYPMTDGATALKAETVMYARRTVTRADVSVKSRESDLRAEARVRGYEGEHCRECGNFTLVRNGTCLKCDTCGGTSGCS